MTVTLVVEEARDAFELLRQRLPEVELVSVREPAAAGRWLKRHSSQCDAVVAPLPQGYEVARTAHAVDASLGVLLLSDGDLEACQRNLRFSVGLSTHVQCFRSEDADAVADEVRQIAQATRQRRRFRVLLGDVNARIADSQPLTTHAQLRRALDESEERRAKLIRELEAAVKLRDEFLTIAAHELRTPLTSLRLNIDSARLVVGEEALRKKLESISRQERRLTSLVELLLDVSRLQAGRRKLSPEKLDLREMVTDALARFQLELERSGSKLTLFAPAPVWGSWDRAALDSVLTNLLSNALKYGAGSHIEVRLTSSPERVRLTVRDEGIGIPAEHLPHLFAPFSRAVSERNYSGFGVGLWISRSMVLLHGGELTATSELEKGTEFVMTLPLR